MSYIKKIEDDYNKGTVTIDEIGTLRQKYDLASKAEQNQMDEAHKTEPTTDEEDDNSSILLQLNQISNTVSQNNLILWVFAIIAIISLVFSIITLASI